MDVKEIIKKIEDIPKPKVKKACIAYSGGLDSCLGVEFLRRVYGADEIVAVTLEDFSAACCTRQ